MAQFDTFPSEMRELQDPITGTRLIQLTAHPASHLPLAAGSSFTPSGHTLLLCSSRGADPERHNLFQLQLPTGELTQITETDQLDPASVALAADGKRAVASLLDELAAVELETGEWETLAVFSDGSLTDCHLSASGEYALTVLHRGGTCSLMAVHTEGMRTVPILEELAIATRPRFSPDSRNSVLYLGAKEPERAEEPSPFPALRCVEFDGSNDRRLYPARHPQVQSDAPIMMADWIATGEEVLFIAGPGRGPLLILPRQGGLLQLLSQNDYLWACSNPSGTQIIALAAPPGIPSAQPEDRAHRGHQIVLLDLPSGATIPICSGLTGWARPTFSPNGRSILYADPDEHGHSQLYLAPLLPIAS
jgi:Tol biopolymer transport system component